MQSCKFVVVLIASITGTSLPAIAQGAGGGAAAGGAGTGSASAGTTGAAGTGATSGPANANNSQGTQNDPNSPQSKAANTVADQQKAAVSGTNTIAQPGAVGAPGVGVGHSANGLPIGSPGSGLGSPEQPVDGKMK